MIIPISNGWGSRFIGIGPMLFIERINPILKEQDKWTAIKFWYNIDYYSYGRQKKHN